MKDAELLVKIKAMKNQLQQLTESAPNNGQCSCTTSGLCSFHAHVINTLDEVITELRHLATFIERETNQ